MKVISLERSEERRDHFRRHNDHLVYEFFPGVDGMALSREAIMATGLFEPGLPYSLGACGAALSHGRLWDQAMRAGRPLTVAEDDAIFRKDFAAMQAVLLDGLPSGWDIILWGWNFDSILSFEGMPGLSAAMYFDYGPLLDQVEAFQAFSARPALFRLHKCFGLPAYSISPKGAQKLKSRCFPLTRFSLDVPLLGKVPNGGIDVAANRAYGALNAFVCFPPLAITRNERAVSTIQNTPLL